MSSSRMSMRISTGESGMRVLPEMFKHRVLQLAEETVDSLQIIWKEAGYEEIECQGLLGELLHKLKQTCALNLAAEQQILEHAKVEFGSKLDEYDNLCIQLGRLPAAEHLEERNYADKLAELEKMISEIMVEVSERQKLLNAELSVIKTLVDQLGETFPEMSQFSGPEGTPELSDVRVKLLKDYKNELENIKTRRIEKVKEAVNECGTHMKDLVLAEEGIATMSDYEQYKECDNQINRFLSKGEFSFGLTKQDMSVINNRLKSFIDEKDRRREELAKTGAEIARLWTLLRIPTVEREQFQSSFKMNLSMETLAKGHDELKRLKEIRTKSLGRVVTSIRSDILTLWEEAGIESEDQRRREFPMYYEEIEQLEDSSVTNYVKSLPQMQQVTIIFFLG